MDTSAVQRHIHELEAVRKQTRVWQLGIFLTLLVMMVISLVTLRNAVASLVSEGPNREQFVQDLGTRLQQNALPAIEEMGMQALREVDYEAHVKTLNQRTPELAQASLQQMQLLGNNLPTRGQKVFEATFAQVFKEREGKIRAMFPEATDEQVANLLVLLTEEAQTQVVAINDALFTPHKKALDNIVYDLTLIEHSEGRATQGQLPTWEMALLMFDILRADLQALAPQPTAKAPSKPKEPKSEHRS